eukprot:scaffold19080_cov158-Skeletonema_marinoi.AAC.3
MAPGREFWIFGACTAFMVRVEAVHESRESSIDGGDSTAIQACQRFKQNYSNSMLRTHRLSPSHQLILSLDLIRKIAMTLTLWRRGCYFNALSLIMAKRLLGSIKGGREMKSNKFSRAISNEVESYWLSLTIYSCQSQSRLSFWQVPRRATYQSILLSIHCAIEASATSISESEGGTFDLACDSYSWVVNLQLYYSRNRFIRDYYGSDDVDIDLLPETKTL